MYKKIIVNKVNNKHMGLLQQELTKHVQYEQMQL